MQAARGASLTGDANEPDDIQATRPRGLRLRHLALFTAVALAAYAVDVVSKVLAVEHLSDRPDVELIGDFFVLHLVRNPGAAFSTGTGYTAVFTCLAIAAAVVILYLVRRIGSAGWAVALGLLFAGVTGNLTDRLLREPGPLRGHVIDFFMLPHWPVFNVADICINVIDTRALLTTFRGIAVDGSRVISAGDDAATQDPAGQDPSGQDPATEDPAS